MLLGSEYGFVTLPLPNSAQLAVLPSFLTIHLFILTQLGSKLFLIVKILLLIKCRVLDYIALTKYNHGLPNNS